MLFRSVWSVAYSPSGHHIISGSSDRTIRIWDAETSTAVGNPLEGHTDRVLSVAYSPDGRHIVSGSDDLTIRIWDAETGASVGSPLKGHAKSVNSVAYASDGQHIVSASDDGTIRVWEPFPYISIRPSSGSSIHPGLYEMPDKYGWVRDSGGALLYWVPHDYRQGLHSPALLTIPLTSPIRSVSLDFDDFAFGTSWAHIFKSAAP